MKNLTLFQFQYHSDMMPLGPIYLAYGLEKENIQFDLKIYPYYKESPDTKLDFDFKKYPFYKKISNKKTFDLDNLYSFFSHSQRIVAVGCWSDMLPHVLIVLKRLKKNYPKKIIILGGIGPTIVAEDILEKFKFIDFIIKGCGVIPLPQLIKKINNHDNELSNIRGLVYRSQGKIISNPYLGWYLDIPPLPAYHRLKNLEEISRFPIITSFGCPYKCTYCHTRPVSPQKVIYRDLNQVIKELKLIKSIAKQKDFIIPLVDEAFVFNRKRVIQFCNLLRSNKLNIKWGSFARVDCMDEEMLKTMAKAGCVSLLYGIESGSNQILEKIKKGFTIEEALKILMLSKKYIPEVEANFIYLFPFETRKDLVKTIIIALALLSKKIETGLASLLPVKNSEIYLKYKKKLSFSLKVPSAAYGDFYILPRECVSLIKNNPGIFSHFHHYKFKGLQQNIRLHDFYEIGRFLQETPDKIFKQLSAISDSIAK